jgi:hypothetical protein
MKNATDYQTEILASIVARREYELDKNESCDSMLAHLDAYAKRLQNVSVCARLLAANVDSNILNRQERNNARFNIYAFDKLLNDVSFATMNHYSKAILRATLALKSADLLLTHADAVQACTLDATQKDKSRAKIISAARYQKHVALSTASTQSSSSINSLCALSVLVESKNDANHVVYSLADNEHTSALVALAQ